MASMTCSGAVLMAASVASADHGNDCNPTQLPSPQVARRLEFSRSRSSLHVTHYEEVGTVNATGQRHLGQRVRAHALTRGLAVHGVCTASQLRFQRGSKACVHGATCVQGVCARCVCPTGVQGFLALSTSTRQEFATNSLLSIRHATTRFRGQLSLSRQRRVLGWIFPPASAPPSRGLRRAFPGSATSTSASSSGISPRRQRLGP
ncbi:hypothetical protein NFJ02_07g132100 [Pycnococcus provasolii]